MADHPEREREIAPGAAASPALLNGPYGLLLRDPAPQIKPIRKRASSISIDEANKHPRIQDLSLYTPGSSTSRSFSGVERPRELICLCTKAPKVPRPRNAFILYRQHYQAQVASQHKGLANPEISKLIGEQWREQPDEVKDSWRRLAEEEKLRHQRQYPDYRYQPRRGGKANGAGTPASAEGTGEDSSRCPKCGGRYIATPRTPSTPFSAAATPSFAKVGAFAPGNMMPTYISPNPRIIETDHLRRGSASSTMSADSHGTRYTQPHLLRDIDEDYAMMSPGALPDHKRRRFNGPNTGGYTPASPPMGYMPHPADPRFQQQRRSVSGPPVSATGFGPGALPRLGGQMYRMHNGMPPGMQPPPRPSISYQGQVQTPTRGGGPEFDESLRLPPLQTQLPNSPSMISESSPPTATTTQHTGLGIMNPGPPVQRQQQQQQQQRQLQQQPPPISPRWQFLLKLDMLRAISPPLRPPGPGAPPFEVRGPIITIEGVNPALSREITAVVVKALSVSGECAVRIWADDETSTDGDKDTAGEKVGADGEASEKNDERGQKGGFANPLAKYMAKMLKWHRTSQDLVEYITHHPITNPLVADTSSSPNNMSVAEGNKIPSPDGTTDISTNPSTIASSRCLKLPIAVLSTGYSLTISDRYAASLPITDAYRTEDHWRWVATLWRGIVGPDLTVYVKRCAEDEIRNSNCVEFSGPGVVVLRVPENAQATVVDEKMERRLGFEIMEWVRGGGFGPSGSSRG
ncbi:HMG box protein [Xylariales sp. AK1849]|nr:HMG box protein [Xylariales sp. AK1849]